MKTLRPVVIALIFVTTACATTSRRDKERANLYLQIGTGYLSKGQYPMAMSELLRAEQLDPTNPVLLNNLGLAYYVRGHYKDAETKFRKAIHYAPAFSDAKNNLAQDLIVQKQYNEAIKILHEVEGDLTYNFPEKTYSNLGMAYFDIGDYQKAQDYLLRSLQARRESCITTDYYGRTLFELKQYKDSAQVLDNAVNYCRSAHFEEPLFFSAMSYYSVGNKEKSRARLEELLKDYPKSKYVAKAKGMLELLDQ